MKAAVAYIICMLCTSPLHAQDLLSTLQKEYEQTQAATEARFQVAGKYAQALFFNEKEEAAMDLLAENAKHAEQRAERKYAAYLNTVLAINYRILNEETISSAHITRALQFAHNTKDLETKGYVHYGAGWLAVRNNKEAEAVRSFHEALQLYDSATPSATLDGRKSSVYKELTAIYANWREYESQEKYSNLSLQLALKQKEPVGIFEAYMAIGHLHEQHYIQQPDQLKHRDLAEQHYLKAIALYEKNKSRFPSSSNLSFVASNLANLYLRFYPSSYQDDVKYYVQLAKKYGQESEQHNHVASAYGIEAELSLKNGDYAGAKSSLLASLIAINKEPMADQHILLSIFENLSDISQQEGAYKDALYFYKQYIDTYQAIYDKEKLELSKRLESQYEKQKQQQTLQTLQLESEKKEQQIQLMRVLGIQQKQELENFRLRDENNLKRLELSRMEADQQRQALRLSQLESETRATETESYKKELSYREKTNRFYTLLIGVTLLLLLLLFYAYRQRTRHMRQREKLHGLELEKEKQRSNIATLTAMLDGQEQERGRLARDLHDGLGGLLSSAKLHLSHLYEQSTAVRKLPLSKSIEQLDIAVDELRLVAHNLMPDLLLNYGLEEALSDYALRMSNEATEVDVQFLHYNTAMDQEQELITYRIIQELVNNAIKHARPEQIIIQVVEEEKSYTVTVEDDGIGFDIEKTRINNSAGLHNINSRVQFLNGNLHIQSTIDQGSSIEFEFPKKNNHD